MAKKDYNQNSEQVNDLAQEITNNVPSQALSFEQWWTLISTQRKLNERLKKAIKTHMETYGFLASKNYDAGLSHFGL